MDHCDDFTRAELLRATFASAGRGLPAIERGMPVPAGTGLSRRSFVARAGGLALTVFGAQAMSPRAFEEGIASAAAAGPTNPVLVSIFLAGGVDSMSVLAPVADPLYSAYRVSLAVTPGGDADRFRDDSRLYWHPMVSPLRDLHAAGKLTVIPAVGYTSPNQSHFTSRHFWEVGGTDPSSRVGWMGRYLDRHGSTTNPLQGLALSSSLAPALAPAAGMPVAAVSDPGNFTLDARNAWDLRPKLFTALDAIGALPTTDPELRSARRAAKDTSLIRDTLAGLQGQGPRFGAAVPYPAGTDPFPTRLAAIGRMLGDGLPLRCVAVNANGGYDTHLNQRTSLDKNLSLLAQSLAAFQSDLEARGVADRVLVHVWSEFGRRAAENGTGTDHGAAGLSMVMGTRASGATIGQFPGLGPAGLDSGGNLKPTADFRGVYASLLEQWLGVDAEGIIPGASGFSRYGLVAG